MTLYICPHGHNLKGTLEKLYGVAQTNAVEDPNTPDYEGYTEIDWDFLTTVRRPDKDNGPQIVWVCDDGSEWLASQLIRLEDLNK